jgi:hypothetical protein
MSILNTHKAIERLVAMKTKAADSEMFSDIDAVIDLINPDRKPETEPQLIYDESALIAFGNYVLNREVIHEQLQKTVTHADIENFKQLIHKEDHARVLHKKAISLIEKHTPTELSTAECNAPIPTCDAKYPDAQNEPVDLRDITPDTDPLENYRR